MLKTQRRVLPPLPTPVAPGPRSQPKLKRVPRKSHRSLSISAALLGGLDLAAASCTSSSPALGALALFGAANCSIALLHRLLGKRRAGTGSAAKGAAAQAAQRRRVAARMAPAEGLTFSVATFNLRGVSDRWRERKPLLQSCLKEVGADVVCFQECLTGEYGQDRQLLGPHYHVFPCKAALFNLMRAGGVLQWYAHAAARALKVPPLERLMVTLPAAIEGWREQLHLRGDAFRTLRDMAMAPFFGNSVACRIAEAHEIKHSTLVLGDWRAAQRIEFCIGREGGGANGSSSGVDASGGGGASNSSSSSSNGIGDGGLRVWVVNTHLDHEHTDNRQRQALAVCDWMDKEKHDCAAIVLCGDFNGAPGEMFHQVLHRLGYMSAYKSRHGREPEGTWPTGIQAPLMDHGPFECLDYVYVWAAEGYQVRVKEAQVFGLEPAAHDKTLFPSDHAAVKATLEIHRKLPVDLRLGTSAAAAAAAAAGGPTSGLT